MDNKVKGIGSVTAGYTRTRSLNGECKCDFIFLFFKTEKYVGEEVDKGNLMRASDGYPEEPQGHNRAVLATVGVHAGEGDVGLCSAIDKSRSSLSFIYPLYLTMYPGMETPLRQRLAEGFSLESKATFISVQEV